MIGRLMLKGLKRGKARFACAVSGIALAVGTVVFTASLVETNRHQAPELAKRAAAPWAAWRTDGIQMMGRRGGGRPPQGGQRPGMGQRPGAPGQRPGMGGPGMGGGRPTPPPRAADLVLKTIMLEVDYREGGRVLQGPPMMALVAEAPAENPYGVVTLTEGRWPDLDSPEPEIVCVRRGMKRFARGSEPALGSEVVFIAGTFGNPFARQGAAPGAAAPGEKKMVAKVVGYLDGDKLPSMFPAVFANAAALSSLPQASLGSIAFYSSEEAARRDGEGYLTPTSEAVVAGFTGDEQRRMDYATPLLMVAGVLTALALLVQALLLSVESNRRSLMILRTIGLTRSGVVRFVFAESAFAGAVGWALGVGLAILALVLYVAADPVAFPVGPAVAGSRVIATLVVLPFVVLFAVLFALAPALRVRAMDASAVRPRGHRHGMAITFALGFAAFVAVEVWGASLMRAFVPSEEWPDAIVSILPGGIRSTEETLGKLRTVEGVRRLSELVPLQLQIADAEEGRNALILAAEWLPEFNYVEGSNEEAQAAWASGSGVVISEIMARALGLHRGDALVLEQTGRRGGPAVRHALKIAAVADLNWHMVTSRGLVRGLNGSPGMTEGPVFVSFDTLMEIDPMSAMVGPSSDPSSVELVGEGEKPLTHLWVDYDPAFLAEHGVFGAGRLIEAGISEKLGRLGSSTIRLHARDEIADGTLAHGSDVIGQAARVPFVFLAILAIGFVAMLVAEAEAKKPMFAVLRAVGATRAQLALRLVKSALKTALAGIAVGLPLGSLVGWLATFKTGNWPGLPHWFVLPCDVVAEGALGAVLFALAFALPTALLLIKRSTKR